jgi:outer membrane protein assembly factor BamB
MHSLFLFDKEKSGRLPFLLGVKEKPKLIWEVKLPQFPLSGPESTSVLDEEGNVYFGCHNGCIYSLDKEGKVRWQFVTRNKVYSSPLLHNGKIFFCCNGADVVCLSLEGKLLWSFEGFKELKKINIFKKTFFYLISFFTYDYHDKSIYTTKITAWCSPNLLKDNILVVTLYGIGVVALDIDSGHVVWKRSMGVPWNHLTGVAIAADKNTEFVVAVSQTNRLFYLDSNGEIVWKKSLQFGGNSWSNPSIDKENKIIYCSTSFKNKAGWVFKFDFEGTLLWKIKLPGGIRGSITISKVGFVLVPCLNGILYFVNKQDGTILQSLCIGTSNRGLWTTAIIDDNQSILVNVTEKYSKGALLKIDGNTGKIVWKLDCGKVLCVPIADSQGNIYTGTWDSNYMKLEG